MSNEAELTTTGTMSDCERIRLLEEEQRRLRRDLNWLAFLVALLGVAITVLGLAWPS